MTGNSLAMLCSDPISRTTNSRCARGNPYRSHLQCDPSFADIVTYTDSQDMYDHLAAL